MEGPNGCAAGKVGGGENTVVVRESRARAMGVRKGKREEEKRTRWWWALERSTEKSRTCGGDRCGGGVGGMAAVRKRSEVDFATCWAPEERRRNGRGNARRVRSVRLRTAGAEEHAEKTASIR